MDLLRSGTGRDPAVIETELVRLRDDCAALVRELEGRWERAHPGRVAIVIAIGVSLFLARKPLRALVRRALGRRERVWWKSWLDWK